MMACLLYRIGIHADVRYGAVSARWQGLGTWPAGLIKLSHDYCNLIGSHNIPRLHTVRKVDYSHQTFSPSSNVWPARLGSGLVTRLGILSGDIGLHFTTKSFLTHRMTTIATISIAIQTCFVCVLSYFLSHEHELKMSSSNHKYVMLHSCSRR